MRLRPDHLSQIIAALTQFIKEEEATLFLFGSRTQDHLKGGDIDLVLMLRNETAFQFLKQNKHQLLAALHLKLGERKIDLRLALESNYMDDSFFQVIMPGAVQLHHWEKT
jgi:hypothetical protein